EPTASKGCLSFIHIPKTGGSSIEFLAAEAYQMKGVALSSPLEWGDCKAMAKKNPHRLWGMCDQELKCENLKGCGISSADCCHINKTFEPAVKKGNSNEKCSMWHFPPGLDPILSKSMLTCDTFCVVRDPVSKFVSHWKWRNLGRTGCSSEAFAQYVVEELQKTREDILHEDCHFTPQ
ncbi:unnamed protein product, partial [Polarella glacialis]